MSVIIKGMNMPQNCFECALHNYHFCDITGNNIEEYLNAEIREPECVLAETEDLREGTEV